MGISTFTSKEFVFFYQGIWLIGNGCSAKNSQMLLEKHFQVLPIRTTILTYPDTYFLVSQECPYVLSYQANGADKRGLYKQIKSNRANKQNQT